MERYRVNRSMFKGRDQQYPSCVCAFIVGHLSSIYLAQATYRDLIPHPNHQTKIDQAFASLMIGVPCLALAARCLNLPKKVQSLCDLLFLHVEDLYLLINCTLVAASIYHHKPIGSNLLFLAFSLFAVAEQGLFWSVPEENNGYIYRWQRDYRKPLLYCIESASAFCLISSIIYYGKLLLPIIARQQNLTALLRAIIIQFTQQMFTKKQLFKVWIPVIWRSLFRSGSDLEAPLNTSQLLPTKRENFTLRQVGKVGKYDCLDLPLSERMVEIPSSYWLRHNQLIHENQSVCWSDVILTYRDPEASPGEETYDLSFVQKEAAILTKQIIKEMLSSIRNHTNCTTLFPDKLLPKLNQALDTEKAQDVPQAVQSILSQAYPKLAKKILEQAVDNSWLTYWNRARLPARLLKRYQDEEVRQEPALHSSIRISLTQFAATYATLNPSVWTIHPRLNVCEAGYKQAIRDIYQFARPTPTARYAKLQYHLMQLTIQFRDRIIEDRSDAGHPFLHRWLTNQHVNTGYYCTYYNGSVIHSQHDLLVRDRVVQQFNIGSWLRAIHNQQWIDCIRDNLFDYLVDQVSSSSKLSVQIIDWITDKYQFSRYQQVRANIDTRIKQLQPTDVDQLETRALRNRILCAIFLPSILYELGFTTCKSRDPARITEQKQLALTRHNHWQLVNDPHLFDKPMYFSCIDAAIITDPTWHQKVGVVPIRPETEHIYAKCRLVRNGTVYLNFDDVE